MDNLSASCKRDFSNLAAAPKRMHLIDKPCGFASSLAKSSLAHQMRFSIDRLENELARTDDPHVLQLRLEGGSERTPASWTLYADGKIAAHGTGDFAFECFEQSATAFLDVCRDALRATDLPQWTTRECELLRTARTMASL